MEVRTLDETLKNSNLKIKNKKGCMEVRILDETLKNSNLKINIKKIKNKKGCHGGYNPR